MADTLPQYRAWAEIDLSALERNVKKVRAAVPEDIRYVAVVKADAYGHGYRQTVARLMQNGVDAFAVANVREGEAIREVGSGWPIIILSPVLPFERPAVVQLGLTPAISNAEEAAAYAQLARKAKKTIAVHLKVDTGMGRSGIWHAQAVALAKKIQKTKGLLLDGIMTHFASADTDAAYTDEQRSRFRAVLDGLGENIPDWVHGDNSAGFETFSDDPRINAIRIGRLQFGLTPYRGKLFSRISVEPVLSFYSRVCSIKTLPKGTPISYNGIHKLKRKSRVGILSAGYADGIPTQMSNRARVIVNGQWAPILGRVTMDMTMVDLTDIPSAKIEDRATLIGNDGDKTITLIEFSAWSDSIPWEVVTSITQRVPRVYRMGLGV